MRKETKVGLREERVMELAMEAGQLLLENGAEISRISETIRRICQAYGVESEDAFVLSNGIFLTGGGAGKGYFAKVRHILVNGTCLEKVVAVNQLSREIEAGEHTLSEAEEQLREIRNGRRKRSWDVLASGIGSGAFCCFFGGSLPDGAAAFFAGSLLSVLLSGMQRLGLSKITRNIAGSLAVSLFCGAAYAAGAGEHLNYMIIGSVMPLIPGVPFINAIREIANEDYISGAVRMLDAVMVFLCIASGVGLGILLLNQMLGGIFL